MSTLLKKKLEKLDWQIDSTWTLFLDRDGVINERIMEGYVRSIEEFHFLPKVPESIVQLSNFFGLVFVVTNQQGIAKGLMTESNLLTIHRYCSDLLLESNAHIDAYYFAPSLAHENSNDRKPKTGMAMQAKQQFPLIDFSKSIMVGDSNSDIEFGKNAGMKTVFVSQDKQTHPKADITVDSLESFIQQL